jgi:hypothetical protein
MHNQQHVKCIQASSANAEHSSSALHITAFEKLPQTKHGPLVALLVALENDLECLKQNFLLVIVLHEWSKILDECKSQEENE